MRAMRAIAAVFAALIALAAAAQEPYPSRPIAAGASHRLAMLPDVPTATEAGIAGWQMSAWFGVFAPRGTPAEIVQLLNTKLQAVLDEPQVRQRLYDAGAEPLGGSAESFAARYRADYRMWGKFIRDIGLKRD